MSKKTKSHKKGRKGGGFNSPSKKRGRDEVTGLSINIPGTAEVFESDIVRTVDPKALGMDGEYGEVTTEVELGNEYVAFTARDTRGLTRLVWKGDFSYDKKGRLSSALIREVAQDWNPFASNYGGIVTRYRFGALQAATPEGFAIYAAGDEANWETTDTYRPWRHEDENGEEATPIGIIDGVEAWSTGLGKLALESFGEGKFFYEGWQSNPFTPNLI